MKYDYLIVGAGLFGAVCANELTKQGRSVLVIDRRQHIGGNVYTEDSGGIQVHKYGAHIFHTNDKAIWDYVNDLVEFNRFTNSPLANHKGKLYNLPFNMNTFYQLWGVRTPAEAEAKLQEQRQEMANKEPENLEEQAISGWTRYLRNLDQRIYRKAVGTRLCGSTCFHHSSFAGAFDL